MPPLFVRFPACLLVVGLMAATVAAQPQGGFRGPDPNEIVERLDDNRNGQVDPSEMEGRSRFFLEGLARDNNLDLSKPIPNDKLRELFRQRFSQGGFFGPRGDDGGRSSNDSSGAAKAATAALVPGFGTGAPQPKALGFGPDAGESWDVLKSKYDARVIERVQESLGRYDRNKDGILDAEELRNARWSSDPREHDKNKDGKLSRSELAERYKQRYASGYYDGGSSRGGPPFVGGPPGGVMFFGGGPPSGMPATASATVVSTSPRPTSSAASTTSSSTPSSSAGSAPSGGDERIARYAEGLLKQYDGNGDGVLQKDEWSRMRGEPQKADRDNNGLITKDELARQLGDYGRGRSDSSSGGASTATSSGSRSYGSTTNPANGVGGPRKSYRFRTPQERLPKGLPDWFARNDADGDGQIAMAEFSTTWNDAKAAEFAQWDRDGDGLITPKEAAAK